MSTTIHLSNGINITVYAGKHSLYERVIGLQVDGHGPGAMVRCEMTIGGTKQLIAALQDHVKTEPGCTIAIGNQIHEDAEVEMQKKNPVVSCTHHYHPKTGPVMMVIKDGHVVVQCCMCDHMKQVHREHFHV